MVWGPAESTKWKDQGKQLNEWVWAWADGYFWGGAQGKTAWEPDTSTNGTSRMIKIQM